MLKRLRDGLLPNYLPMGQRTCPDCSDRIWACSGSSTVAVGRKVFGQLPKQVADITVGRSTTCLPCMRYCHFHLQYSYTRVASLWPTALFWLASQSTACRNQRFRRPYESISQRHVAHAHKRGVIHRDSHRDRYMLRDRGLSYALQACSWNFICVAAIAGRCIPMATDTFDFRDS